MTNDRMKAGRFLRFHVARKKLAWVLARLDEGKTVQVTTCTKYTRYTKKHRDMFKATKSGLYVQRGKSWDCLDLAKITAH